MGEWREGVKPLPHEWHDTIVVEQQGVYMSCEVLPLQTHVGQHADAHGLCILGTALWAVRQAHWLVRPLLLPTKQASKHGRIKHCKHFYCRWKVLSTLKIKVHMKGASCYLLI